MTWLAWRRDYLARHLDEPTVERLAMICAAVIIGGVSFCQAVLRWVGR